MIKSFYRWAIVTSLLCGAAQAATLGGTLGNNDVLERASERVKLFWDQFGAVTCTENMVQEKLNEKGKPALHSESRYDYLIVLGWDKGDLLVDESRVEVDAPRKGRPTGSLLATRGFATLLFILHPDFRSSYAFSPAVPEPGSNLVRVDFLPRPGARSPGVMELKGREYPITWEGSAWIDPGTAAVVRISASWKEPPQALGLQRLASDVHYGAVQLGAGDAYWLPQSAKIELATQHQSWRNEHRFTNYHRFSVDVKEEVSGPRPLEPLGGGTK